MMNVAEINPINHQLKAIVAIPGSKSLTNRALIISALANGKTKITDALYSDDSLYLGKALTKLGFAVEFNQKSSEILVIGQNGIIPASSAELFIGNSGTAARFLTTFLTLGHGEFILDGDARMRKRPIGDLTFALNQLGANVSPVGEKKFHDAEEIYPPIKIVSSGLPGGKTLIAGNISSQFLSALLMVSPYANKKVDILVSTELNSKPYVDMTAGMMSEFGIEIEREGYSYFSVKPGKYTSPKYYKIEADASAASYFFAASAILGGEVSIKNLTLTSKQGDVEFLKILTRMGCSVYEEDNLIRIVGPASSEHLNGVSVDLRDIPDVAQTLAAIAPFATSPTTIRGIASARLKECDRISDTCAELSRLGVNVEEYDDGMTIYPCAEIRPGLVHTYNDHRMAMSFSLIGLKIAGIQIENPSCVSKTFPDYFETLQYLN